MQACVERNHANKETTELAVSAYNFGRAPSLSPTQGALCSRCSVSQLLMIAFVPCRHCFVHVSSGSCAWCN